MLAAANTPDAELHVADVRDNPSPGSRMVGEPEKEWIQSHPVYAASLEEAVKRNYE